MKQTLSILVVLLVSYLPLFAQISGPSTVTVGSTHTYSYSNGMVFGPNWLLNIPRGTITSQWQSGSTYYASITWNSVGSDVIVFFDMSQPLAQLNVNITASPPSVPTANAATNVSSTSFTANWTAVSGATNYKLDVSTVSNFSSYVSGFQNRSVSGTSESVTGLNPNTTYYYRVRAQNSGGTSGNSGTITTQTAPAAPTATSPSSVTHQSFIANWNSVTGATSYRLDVSTVSNFASFVGGYNNLVVAGTSQLVSPLNPNTTYYYRVRAVGASGTSGNSNTISQATQVAPPTVSAATNITSQSFTANWGTVSGATHYLLEVSTASNFSSFVPGYNPMTLAGATTANVTGLSGGTTYYYRVRAQNSGWTTGYSSVINLTTIPMPPLVGSPTSITANSFVANWDTSVGATSYRLDISTNSSFSSYVSGYDNLTVSGTSTTVSGLTANTTYYFRVRAVNGTGTSANSATGTALTAPVPPVAATATNVSNTSFTANWSSVPGAASYTLDVSTVSNFSTFVPGYQGDEVTGTSVDVVGLAGNTTYYYRVRAVNAEGTPSVSSNSVSKLTLPDAPVALAATSITSSGFTANWTAVAGISSYRLDVSTNSEFTSLVSGFDNLTVTGTSKVVSALTDGKTYYYRVRAVNSSGSSANSNTIIGASLDRNYVRTTGVYKRGITTQTQLDGAGIGERQITTAYFDGLGRPMQTVIRQNSPNQFDVVQPMAYDVFGREKKKYLPYVVNESNGLYKLNPLGTTTYTGSPHNLYYTNGTGDKVADDSQPFSETVFEPSPLNRVIEQGSPGTPWQPDGTDSYTSTDRTVKYAYETNVASEVLKWSFTNPTSTYPFGQANAGTAASPTYHAANQLFRNKTKDEHHNEVIEYKDRQGKVILKKVQAPSGQWAQTYYIYDGFGNLVCVMPPEAVARLATEFYHSGATDATKEAFLRRWAFRYAYDARKRMTLKQVPGADAVCMVYDKRDRLVLTQDGNHRSGSTTYWTFTKYDELNRPILTGIKDTTAALTQAQMQSVVDAFYNKAWTKYGETYVGTQSGNVHGYSNKSYPVVNKGTTVDLNQYLTVTYYDTYSFRSTWTGTYTYSNDALSATANGVVYDQPSAENQRVNGQVTGIKVKVLDGGVTGGATWLKAINYYDNYLRVIQTQSDNNKGGIDRVSTLYDFTGRVLKTKITHPTSIAATRIISRRFEYDHAGRLVRAWHQTDSQPEILLAYNEYNELGQLVDKKLHSTNSGASDAIQSVDYRYNIRGWLTSINNAELNVNSATNDETGDFFGMNLAYQDALGTGNTAQYNGNISGVKWSVNQGFGTIKAMAYNYTYDPMNRLTAAMHKQAQTLGTWATGQFDESGLTYDLNGNIKTLQRKGDGGTTIDNLTYNYGSATTASNKLLYVTDAASVPDKAQGFFDGNTTGDDYTYDANGNMLTDKNKGITTEITYNYLNLPELITKGGNTVRYIYDATGRKLTQVVTFSGATKRTDYAGEFIYENDVLQFINHEEGRIVVSGEKLVHRDGCENTGNKTASNATLATYTANGEEYIKVTASGTTVKTGVFPIGGSFAVAPGQRYRIRAKGYRTGANAVYLLIRANTTDMGWPGAALPNGAGGEAWIEQIVTIPSGATTLQAGVTWNTVTAGEIFYLNEFEIEALTTVTPEYQYHLKDHLGNVRVTFTSKEETDIYTATLENNTQATEQATFRNYSRVTADIYDHTDAGTTYDKAQLLNGGNNSQVGLTKSLAVMPGDTVSAEVYAKYFESTGGSGNLTGFAAALLSAFGLPTPAGGEAGTAAAALQDYGSFIAGGGNPGTSGWPKGWLNMLVFDKDYNLVDLAYEQLDAAYMQPVGNVNKLPMQKLSVSKTIKEPGYVYIYLSNEGSVQQDIYFDDLKITHRKSRVVQADDYYPFGLSFNSYQRENSVDQKYLYNGMEAQKELNIGWYDFGARYYDPAICKFLSVDPLTEKYPGMSPYAGFANNPVRYTDPTGMEIEEGSRDEWNRQRQAVEGRRDQLQGKIDRLNAKAEAKGWSQEKLASKVGNLNERVASLNTSIATMGTLEASTQVYGLNKNRCW